MNGLNDILRFDHIPSLAETSQESTDWHPTKALLVSFELDRLGAFAQNPAVNNGIRVVSDGVLVYTLHSAVGFFNKIHGLSMENQHRLPKMLAQTPRGYPDPGIEVYEEDQPALDNILRSYGYAPDVRNVIVAAQLRADGGIGVAADQARQMTPDILISPVDSFNIDAFSDLYIDAFEATSTPRWEAISNMRYYPSVPGWFGYLASDKGRPAGIAATYCQTEQAFLCAGATRGDHRSIGLHKSLISHRLHSLLAMGIKQVVSYAPEGSRSLHNLCAAGLRPITYRTTYRSERRNEPAAPRLMNRDDNG